MATTKRSSTRSASRRVALAIATLAALGGATQVLASSSGHDWPTIGHDPANTRNQPFEHKIKPSNVNRLAPKWVATTTGDVSATPAVVKGAVYFGDFGGTLWKLDADTGATIWSHSVPDYTGFAGDYARTSPSVIGRTLVVGIIKGSPNAGPNMLGIDTRTGALRWKTQIHALGGSGANVFRLKINHHWRDVIGVGGKSGVYIVLDAETGAFIWNSLVGRGGDQGGMNWGTAYDGDRIYVSITNQHNVPYQLTQGEVTSGAFVTGGSWAALDPATGKQAHEQSEADPAWFQGIRLVKPTKRDRARTRERPRILARRNEKACSRPRRSVRAGSWSAYPQQGAVMAVGPVDVYIIGFPGNKFTGRIAPAILDLVENGTIRVLDLLFVMKDAEGVVTTVAAADIDEEGAGFLSIDITQPGALGPEDAEEVSDDLPANSSALLIAFENLWVGKVVDALRAADAVLIDQIRIPVDVVEAFEAS
jgi:outer membrane protein assembly factor BamB